MNMKCEIIRDLLPLYIDGVASKESEEAIKEHLAVCPSCGETYAKLQAGSSAEESAKRKPFGDAAEQMTKSLRKVKKKINARTVTGVVLALAFCGLACLAYVLLFMAPLKTLSPDDISVSAKVYPISELMPEDLSGNADSVRISFGEEDTSDYSLIRFPEFSADVVVSDEVASSCGYVTVIGVSSEYLLREMLTPEPENDETLVISALKTTVFDNKRKTPDKCSNSIEFRKISKIVYDNGKEQKVLWEQ